MNHAGTEKHQKDIPGRQGGPGRGFPDPGAGADHRSLRRKRRGQDHADEVHPEFPALSGRDHAGRRAGFPQEHRAPELRHQRALLLPHPHRPQPPGILRGALPQVQLDTHDSNSSTTTDDLEKIERALFNSFGISQNLFNTDGNLSLEKSILNDESIMRNLLLQFHIVFDNIIQKKFSKKGKYVFKFYMLETTQYNYKELSKMYKEQTQNGYSKMLPQIALGHSQSFILNTAYFENDTLKLQEVMIPPLMSSTLNGQDVLGNKSGNSTTSGSGKSTASSPAGGRPEKPDDQKSEKTIKNKESMG